MTPTLLMACRTHRTPGCPICVPAAAELREETAKRQCAERLAKASRRRSRLNCVIGFGVCLLFSAVLLLVDQTATLTEERDQLQTKNAKLRESVLEWQRRTYRPEQDLTSACVAWWMKSSIAEARRRICSQPVLKSISQKKGK